MTQADYGWTVTIDAVEGERTLTDRQVEQLVDLFNDFSGAVAFGPGRVGVTFAVDVRDLRAPVAPSILSAVDYACEVFTLHLAAIGEAGWTIVNMHARTFDEHDAEPAVH
jgi:hypothetical protein